MLKHLAIIMDGNRTWAKNKNLPKLYGHKVWAENVEKTIFSALQRDIKYITLWWLSTDNLEKRKKKEVDDIVNIINWAKKYLKKIMKQGWKIQLIWDINRLPEESQKTLHQLVEETKQNTKIIITLALAYGWQDEIIRAVKKVLSEWKDPESITREEFRKYLDVADLPVVDMIVRTWWHKRLSWFLLYDSEYSESCFLDINWPDFNESHLDYIIEQYNQSKRKFWK